MDVDWYVEDDQKKLFFDVDQEKAAYHGIATETVARTVQAVLNGTVVGRSISTKDQEPVELLLRAPLPDRAGLERLKEITLTSADGAARLPVRTG